VSDYYQTLEKDLFGLMADVGAVFEPDAAQEVQMYLDAGEFALALEAMCAVLMREQQPVSAATYVKTSALGERLGVAPDCWLDMVVS
jgi:hypothetical protein